MDIGIIFWGLIGSAWFLGLGIVIGWRLGRSEINELVSDDEGYIEFLELEREKLRVRLVQSQLISNHPVVVVTEYGSFPVLTTIREN